MSRRKQSNPKSLKNDTEESDADKMEDSEWDETNELDEDTLTTDLQSDEEVIKHLEISDTSDIKSPQNHTEETNDLKPKARTSNAVSDSEEQGSMKKEASTPSPSASPDTSRNSIPNPLLTPGSLADAVLASSGLSHSLFKSQFDAPAVQLNNLLRDFPLLQSVLPALRGINPGNTTGVTSGPGGAITCVCGVKFYSTSNFEAHRAFYCTHRTVENNGDRKTDNESPTKTDDEASSSPGRILKCPHCPYTTTHKLSLNGHMNIHTSPEDTTTSQKPPSFPVVTESRNPDRYCTDCDIQFSSVKTFRVHKAHYCQTRHVHKGSKSPARDENVNPIAGVSGISNVSANGTTSSQPVFALPTNPVLLVPYSVVAGAQILPPHFLPQSGAAFIFANGQVHPLPTATSPLGTIPPIISPETQVPMDTSTPKISPSKLDESGTSKAKLDKNESKKQEQTSKRRIDAEIPLDLTTKRPKLSIKTNLLNDEEKENREINGSKEEKSSPRHFTVAAGEFEGKLLSSPQASPTDDKSTMEKSPRPGASSATSSPRAGSSPRPSTSIVSTPVSPSRSPMNSQPSLPSLLPGFPNPMLGNLESLGGNIPLAGLQCLQNLPNVPRDLALKLMAPDSLLNGLPPVISPPVMVKQGEAKCNECNIVFFKEENLLIHKKHYCSARDASKSAEEDNNLSKSPLPTTSSDTSSSKSPVRELTKAKEASKPAKSHMQYICNGCGIRFSAADSLAAHQATYCPKTELSNEEGNKGSWKCTRCKVRMPENMQAAHQCISPAPTQSHGWKCPCCPVVSPTATAAQKHLETHAGIRAFRCVLCGYRGNTLRGMRTHIRMHFDVRPSEYQEERYIACILEDDDHRGRGNTDARRLIDSSRLLLENPALSTLLNESNLPDQVEPPLSCSFCPFITPARSTLIQHLLIAHNMGFDGKCVQDIKTSRNRTDENSPPAQNRNTENKTPSPVPSIKMEPQIKIEVHEPRSVTPVPDLERSSPSVSVSVSPVTNGRSNVCYCQICNIEFSRLESYMAHRRYYCRRPQSTTPPETTVQ